MCFFPRQSQKQGFTILFLLAWAVYASLCGQEVLQRENALSTIPLTTSYDSGEYYDPCPIRLFSDDDYGLLALCQFLGTDRGMQISDPSRLLPEGKQGLFIGIVTPGQEVSFRREEVEYFAGKGNVVILLTSSDGSQDFLASLDLCFATSQASKDAPRPLQALSEEWHAWNDEKTVFVRQTANDGRIVVIGDSFAFCQKRFVAGNRELLNELLSSFPLELKAARVIQRKRYIREDGKAIYGASSKRLPFPREHDPAFAPALTDSNDKETYLMTQQEFFSDERYYEEASTENSEFHNMMRVRVYDQFVPPDSANPIAWHFAIGSPEEKEVVPQPNFQVRGYKVMKVATLFKPGIPEEFALLASLDPEAKLLDICLQNVGLKDSRETELEVRVNEQRIAVEKLQEGLKPQFSLDQLTPWLARKQKEKELAEQQQLLEDAEAELRRVKAQNGRPDLDRLEGVVSGVDIKVYADGLGNWRVETTPSVEALTGRAVVYHVAYRTDYLRDDNREFKAELLPAEITISQWRTANERAGVLPCELPVHEREALRRLADGRRAPWLVADKAPMRVGQEYLPPLVRDALTGMDVRVLPLLQELTSELGTYKDAVIQLKDEFNSFSEAMVYWRSGVCRHRARTAFMLLNAMGIPARLVVSRSHAFVEIFVPKDGGGFWTQVNFGGGFGDEPGDFFPKVSLPIAAEAIPDGLPVPPIPLSSPSPSPIAVPPSPISVFWWALGGLATALLLAVVMRWLMKHRMSGQQDNRIPMTSLTDFMLSQSQILDYDFQRGECRGAALVLLEAALPRLQAPDRERYALEYQRLQATKTVSRAEYQNLANELATKWNSDSQHKQFK